MPRQVALIQRAISRAALQHGVSYVNGWESRGHTTFNPRGVVCHHDASNTRSGNNGALNIIIHGRGSIPGPLSQFQIARNGLLWVVASGRANHAGQGGYRGLSGNASVMGIEVANNGVGEHWRPACLDTYYRLVAALLDEMKLPTIMAPGHLEWTSRKIDPRFSSPQMNMTQFRSIVGRVRGGDMPIPSKKEREIMYKFFQPDGLNQIWAVSAGGYGFHLTPGLYREMSNGPAMESNVINRVSRAQLKELTAGRFAG